MRPFFWILQQCFKLEFAVIPFSVLTLAFTPTLIL